MSTWYALLNWYEYILVWPLALAVGLLWVKGKGRVRHAWYALAMTVVFLPHIQRQIGNLYFDYLCRTQAGEFIYRTVENVEGIYQIRPRDGRTDYLYRMQDGDIPEDPYGHTDVEAQRPWILFLQSYQYFERPAVGQLGPHPSQERYWNGSMFGSPKEGEVVARYFGYDKKEHLTLRREFDRERKSRFGFDWVAHQGALAWLLNVYGGETRAIDMTSGDVLGLKRGFIRVRPYDICPADKDHFFVLQFLVKVLQPPHLGPRTDS